MTQKLVSELEGAELDYWVAQADGLKELVEEPGCRTLLVGSGYWCRSLYHPSVNWAQGGPIIEREHIAVVPIANGVWVAEKWIGEEGTRDDAFVEQNGESVLSAAMRVFVASKFGNTVDMCQSKG
jgi:hypothetical protein